MSRAFVKENDLEHAGIDIPERIPSPHPNYVTPQGLQQLQTRVNMLQAEQSIQRAQPVTPYSRQQLQALTRDLAYFQLRLEQAIVVPTPQGSPSTVLFGATVTVEDEDGNSQQFHVVGEDEADIKQHKISWTSPLGQALLGHQVGETVLWQRPAGATTLEIMVIHYLTETSSC